MVRAATPTVEPRPRLDAAGPGSSGTWMPPPTAPSPSVPCRSEARRAAGEVCHATTSSDAAGCGRAFACRPRASTWRIRGHPCAQARKREVERT
ncbi:hypothetical protein ACP70R_023303 [Stipagrostis hirtigluma subsp. patula]